MKNLEKRVNKHFDRDRYIDSPVMQVETDDIISTVSKLHKLSYRQLSGGALIVADRDKISDIRNACHPRMLDTLSFCRDKMHFELIGRPPVIIFVTDTPIEIINQALFSKTGFSKPSEFTAYYVMFKEKEGIIPSFFKHLRNFLHV